MSDDALLDLLTGPALAPATGTAPVSSSRYKRRDAPLDPLLLAAAVASGPHVTRHHHHHNFELPDAILTATLLGDTKPEPEPEPEPHSKQRYESRQAPRRERLRALAARDQNKENASIRLPVHHTRPGPRAPSPVVSTTKRRLPASPPVQPTSPYLIAPERPLAVPSHPSLDPKLEVQCLVRTRIPTPHGQVFLHLYRNNRDSREHLAIVVDPAQLEPQQPHLHITPLRSASLEAIWSATETDEDRIVRGAYTGRLGVNGKASSPIAVLPAEQVNVDLPAPLVRIHSECFTGETVRSMRCDCGEQLDEAIRRISEPMRVQTPLGPVTLPGRGVVVYMRQEGRGIGLAAKLRAYNLQDLGYDTVAANLMLGFQADERRYEIAASILRDLGLGHGVRLLTNNPDKMAALAAEGIRLVDRVEMVPKAWKCNGQLDAHLHVDTVNGQPSLTVTTQPVIHGEDLDKYLKTKVTRMGHMLHVPSAVE